MCIKLREMRKKERKKQTNEIKKELTLQCTKCKRHSKSKDTSQKKNALVLLILPNKLEDVFTDSFFYIFFKFRQVLCICGYKLNLVSILVFIAFPLIYIIYIYIAEVTVKNHEKASCNFYVTN